MEYDYKIMTNQGLTEIKFDEEGNLRIEGPKKLISKIVGGLGEENETRAWVTQKELKTEAQRMYTILEIAKQRI